MPISAYLPKPAVGCGKEKPVVAVVLAPNAVVPVKRKYYELSIMGDDGDHDHGYDDRHD